MMVSPGSIRLASFITVLSVASPAGTITHAARGLVSFLDEVLHGAAAGGAFRHQAADVGGVQVEYHALVSATH